MKIKSSLSPSGNIYTVSVLIATKNRSAEMREALASLAEQCLQPMEVIIFDQSAGDETAHVVQQASESWTNLKMVYVHDASLSGASAGRNKAMEKARGTIWLFIDDDVRLEQTFIQEMLQTYQDFPQAAGVCGMITNYKAPSTSSRIFAKLFMLGPFHDERQSLYWDADRLLDAEPVAVRKFGATMMSFRADAIAGVSFDLNPAAFPAEDVDFCLHVSCGNLLLLAPRARGEHKRTVTARVGEHWLRESSRSASYLYRKHWRTGLKNRACFWWLQLGYACAALVGSMRRHSLDPFRALWEGFSLAPSPR